MRPFRRCIAKFANAQTTQPLPPCIHELEIVWAEGVAAHSSWGGWERVIATNGKVQNSELDNIVGLVRSLVEILEFFVGACGYLVVVVIDVSDCNFVDRNTKKELQLESKLRPSRQFLESSPSSMVIELVQFKVYRRHEEGVWGKDKLAPDTYTLILNSALRQVLRPLPHSSFCTVPESLDGMVLHTKALILAKEQVVVHEHLRHMLNMQFLRSHCDY
jgi:hypothetical protein